MASALSYRPGTSGGPKNGIPRKASLASFPSTAKLPTTPSFQQGVSFSTNNSATRRKSSSSLRSATSSFSMQRMSSQMSALDSRKRLRSQYPPDSAERHVEYILVASFDIDKGSIMEHQYPNAISGDENMLAELMLPDQAHARTEDWTIFFLHKDIDQGDDAESGEEGEEDSKTPQSATKGDDNEDDPDKALDEEDGEDEDEGPPLIYVLNLVNTKHDASAKRGAVVKAMAICTRHPFLHIYKPLLLLGLEEYYRSPTPETLEILYNSVNAMDLSLMPKLSMLERQILLANDTKDLFIEKFELMVQQRMLADADSALTAPVTPSRSGDTTGQRLRHGPPRDTHEFESKVVYNGIPVPIKVPSVVSPETVGDFSIVKLIQTFHTPQASSPQPFALHAHLTTNGAFTHPIIVLINAVLTQKRVIFIGHNRPSGEVAEAVLATCALASGGILKGFTRHAFPYTDLTKIDDLLNVPGFIAGVTNPTFANHPEWWDLLCDIPTGRMKISSKIEPAAMTDGLVYFQQQNPGVALGPSSSGKDASNADTTRDGAFMDSVINGIASRHGETAIRTKFRAYVHKFTRIAATFEEAVYGASALSIGATESESVAGTPVLGSSSNGLANSATATAASSTAQIGANGSSSAANNATTVLQGHGYVWPDEVAKARDLGANIWRIEGWRNTRSYYALIQDTAAAWERKPVRAFDLAHQHDRLRYQKLSREDSAAIYASLADTIHSYEEICQLLTVAPQGSAGLFYLGLGCFHQDAFVRHKSVDLIERIMGHEAGRHFWSQMSRFEKQGFMRARRDRDRALLVQSAAVTAAGEGDVQDSPTQHAGEAVENGLGIGLGVSSGGGPAGAAHRGVVLGR